MSDLRQVDFYLVRYCGNPLKRETINVGVLALSNGRNEHELFTDIRFTHSWRRVLCFDPQADIEAIQALQREIWQDLQDPQRRADFLKRARETYSGTLMVDFLQTSLTESPATALSQMSSTYLETPAGSEKRDLSGRQRIVGIIKDELERAGVLPLMLRDIAMAEYTRPGDPLKLDFGYPVEGAFKFLHAVSLAQRVDSGMMLAARFPQIAAGIRAKKGAQAWLTAVVDDDLPKRDEVSFALEMMQESGIVVARAAEMPEVAEGVRLELRV